MGVARHTALRAHIMSPLSLLFFLSTSLTLISCRQTPNIKLVKTNNYFRPITRGQSVRSQPIRRQISGGYQAPSSYGAPAASAPSEYGQPVAAVVEAKAAPRCTTVYEDECSTVEEEECNTVNDEICEVTNEEQKCDSVTDTINEQSCQSRTERKCST